MNIAIVKFGAPICCQDIVNKSINTEIKTAQNAYETELLSINEKLVNTLNAKSSLQLGVISEVTAIVKRDVKKAEKKALKKANKA